MAGAIHHVYLNAVAKLVTKGENVFNPSHWVWELVLLQVQPGVLFQGCISALSDQSLIVVSKDYSRSICQNQQEAD